LTLVVINTDAGRDASHPLTQGPPPSAAVSYYDHQAIDFTSAGEWYYVRINGVLAPSIAGRYFFKILLYGGGGGLPTQPPAGPGISPSICADIDNHGGTANGRGGLPGENCSEFVPTENWPVLLVKGEIDPAIVTGTIRYGGYNSTLYGRPIGEAGMVLAKMQTRLDPYTSEQRPDLPTVDAQGYFNATATGHYEVEGLAPGIYDVYAEAAGFPQQVCASSVTVLKGQSLHFDCYVQPGPVIHGNVFTKHQFGDEPWMGETLDPSGKCLIDIGVPASACYNEYIKIEFYDAPTLNNIPNPGANLVSWSPLPCVAGGQDIYTGKYDAGSCGNPRSASQIAFPWHEYTPCNGYLNAGGTFSTSTCAPTSGYYQVSESGEALGVTPIGCANTFCGRSTSVLLQDPQGVGPPQNWFVQGGTTTPFHFEFGVKGEYGAPRDLDGQVPQVYATWVNGLTPGRYYARAWVFRYVQTALDGSTFQEYYFDVTPQEWAGDVTLPIDLRLSSWVNKTVHFHDQVNGLTEDPIDTGAGAMSGVLVDANGQPWSYNQTLLGYLNECTAGTTTVTSCYTHGRNSGWGSAAFSCPFNKILFSGYTCTTINRNDLDKAGLNRIAINTGRANIQFWGWNDTWGGENYGIPSGTYTPHVFVLGYLEQSQAEQVSVTLSGTPTSVSDHMYRGAGFNITVYSIDWERPTVNRNWEYGNRVGYTECGFLVPVAGGLNTCAAVGHVNPPIPNDPRCVTFPDNSIGCMVGEEIDIGIFQNGHLVDFIGDVPSNLQDTVLTSCLFQSQSNSSIQMCGGGWDPMNGLGQVLPMDSNSSYFGQELSRLGLVGGYMGGLQYFSVKKVLFGPAHYSPTTLPDGGVYNQAVSGYLNLYPSSLASGQYDFRGFTYGYVQDQDFSVYAAPTEVADIRLNLVIGVNVTLDILFKKEHVITPTAQNMSARVRLFDDSGSLVAEWMSSEGTYVPPNHQPFSTPNGLAANGRAVAADGTNQFPFGPLHPAVPVPLLLNTYNYLPGGVTLLHLQMAGLPQVPPGGTDAGPGAGAQNGAGFIFIPQQAYPNDPILAVTTCGFEVDCYATPGTSLGVGVPGYFPNTGILGNPDYQGGWTAEVDFVNWYNNNTRTTEWSALPFGCGPAGTTCGITGTPAFPNGVQYFPPPDGLLLGESYHIIPGTTATSGISLTEDLALTPQLVGHSMVANHLGPYSQEGVWQISGAHLSGEASGVFEVDLNGFISGTALAFTWANDFRPLSWATVAVTGAPGGETWNYYTYDGEYQMYLPGGSYSLAISSPGIASQTLSVAVTGGEASTAGNVYMQQSNIPVPEFSGMAVVAFTALAASLFVLRRKRR